ncbi:MAG: hypothetical protein QOD88_1954 [Mycobacterium sp.]|jgi:hypothetical protein|nr:hypothetical protein [Mycobacterium sp.]
MVLLSAQDVQLGAADAITQASAPPTRHLGRRRDRRSPAQWLPFPKGSG